ncbi:RecBCD enzyme subunit RecC [Serratia symbiotica]|nr:RecBCD enzyme subunit RecC [Serratia symbiotica]
MFIIYHSNQLHLLKILLNTLLKKNPLKNPLQQEIILVENISIAQWLQTQFTKEFHISANINYSILEKFIWDIFNKVLFNISEKNTFNTNTLTWKLMYLIEKFIFFPSFSSLRYYLTNDKDKNKIYQLSNQIAYIFKEYIIYRPQWLKIWQHKKYINELTNIQKWQAKLWRGLIQHEYKLKKNKWNPINLYDRCINILNNTKNFSYNFPHRIFIYNLPTIPPIYLNLLKILSHHIDIHLMVINPCKYFWGDIQENISKNYKKNNIKIYSNVQKKTYNFNLKIIKKSFHQKNKKNNPLLTSWGKLKHDYLHCLLKLNTIKQINNFINIPTNSMLHTVQNNILELKNCTMFNITNKKINKNINKFKLKSNDNSFSIHNCHNQQHEIEILHNQLLTMLIKDPKLMPEDILVIVTDIKSYIPYIKNVFNNVSKKYYLPFSIPNYKSYQNHPIFKAFISLLDLPINRSTSEQILELLEIPEIAMNFNIDKEELILLHQWIDESGIRWGLDNHDIHKLNLPITKKNTWKFGIKRMLLGYAMHSKIGSWKDIFPYDESSGSAIKLTEKLEIFINSIKYWKELLNKKKPLKKWLPLCKELINTFFIQNNENTTLFNIITTQWKKNINYGLTEKYINTIPLNILKNNLIEHVKNIPIKQQYIAKKINFYSIENMRSVPFKVICLLGMNNKIYPRTQKLIEFNLIKQQPQYGDYNKNNNDRDIFLNAILSARQKIYISFIGYNIKNNQKYHPSFLITELLEYLEQIYYLNNNEKFNINLNMLHIKNHILKKHSYISFSFKNFICNSKYNICNPYQLLKNNNIIKSVPFNKFSLPQNIKKISLKNLQFFYNHPIRAFFQLSLGVNFNIKKNILKNEEPFIIDKLTQYKLNNELLRTMIEGKDYNYIFQREYISGKLPFKSFGKIYWQKQEEDMINLAKKIRSEYNSNYKLKINFKINNIYINGDLNQVQKDGLLRWKPKKLSIIDGIQLWLEHLIYCCNGGIGNSRMYGKKNTIWHFPSLTLDKAQKYLTNLILGYQYGLCNPLLLLNKSGWGWLTQCFQKNTQTINWTKKIQDKAIKNFLYIFNGNQYIIGEGKDPYIQRILYNLDDIYLKKILSEVEHYFLPIIQNHIFKND